MSQENEHPFPGPAGRGAERDMRDPAPWPLDPQSVMPGSPPITANGTSTGLRLGHVTDQVTDQVADLGGLAFDRQGRLSLEGVAALVELASGADIAAIEGLEAIVANLRRAAAARAELAAHVPPQMLRQVLLARAVDAAASPSEHDPRGERS